MNKVAIDKIIFLDIESVPQAKSLEDLNEKDSALWQKKSSVISKYQPADISEDELYQRAGIYAEFGKVICISLGVVYQHEERFFSRMTSFSGEDEKQVLQQLADLLNERFGKSYLALCAHNGQEFDFPYLCRRMLINGISLPLGLKIMGNKPWENKHLIDTMRLWAFGDYKSFTSLETLAHCFNIPTPKDDISGADVYKVYYEEENLERIVNYCQKDVLTLMKLYSALCGGPEIKEG